MIRFVCPECGAARKVPDDMAGRKIKCEGCQTSGHLRQFYDTFSDLPPDRLREFSVGQYVTIVGKADRVSYIDGRFIVHLAGAKIK
jgi:hypothetical protein